MRSSLRCFFFDIRLRRFLITEPTKTSQKDFVARKSFGNLGYHSILAYARVMTQKQVYTVVSVHDGFEIRNYADCVLVQAIENGEFMSAGNSAFRYLLGFISGNNSRGQKIAMTAPVIQQPLGPRQHIVSFVMPADFRADDTPAPLSSVLSVTPVPAHLAAARAFRGPWNAARFEAEGQALLEAVAKAELSTKGSLYWSRFDPPFKPGFLKHNEVLIDLES